MTKNYKSIQWEILMPSNDSENQLLEKLRELYEVIYCEKEEIIILKEKI